MKEITMATLLKMQEAMILAAENVLKDEGFAQDEVCIVTKVAEMDGVYGFYQGFSYGDNASDDIFEDAFEKLKEESNE